MIFKGYNTEKGETVLLSIDSDGVILGLDDWRSIEEKSVRRYSEKQDIEGKMIFEGDSIESVLNGLTMTVRYGEYEAYCPEDEEWMTTVGFYAEAEGYRNMPLGPTEEYARVIA